MTDAATTVDVTLSINGTAVSASIEPRLVLSDFVRHTAGLTGTHVGCEHGVCGACTVLVDGEPQRSCLVFAVQVEGCELTTIEGLAGPDEPLHPVQQAFTEAHGLQCGFCTPGFVLSTAALLDRDPQPSDADLRDTLGGHICRCTGYRGIVHAARLAQEAMSAQEPGQSPEPLGPGDAGQCADAGSSA